MAPDRPTHQAAPAVGGASSDLEWHSPITPQLDAELRAEGRSMVRLLHQMRVALPLPSAVVAATRSIDVRPFVPGSDDDAWLTVNNAAFAWHPDQGGWDRDRLQAAIAEPWVRLEGFLVHDGIVHDNLVHDNLAHDGPGTTGTTRPVIDGFCWTREHPAITAEPAASTAEPALGEIADPALGEIFVIAADPSTTGTGLGAALTVAGLAHLATRGLHVGMLYVEAINTPALRLYERLGFVVHHSTAAYTPATNSPATHTPVTDTTRTR